MKEQFETAAKRALARCGLKAVSYAQSLAPVDTGNLRNSITYKVIESEKAVYIGTNADYAAYVELGTGIYAKGGGRPTPWVWQDDEGNWHRTAGQTPQPFIRPAVADHRQVYKKIIDDEFRNG